MYFHSLSQFDQYVRSWPEDPPHLIALNISVATATVKISSLRAFAASSML